MTALITRPDTLPDRYDKAKFTFLASHIGQLVIFKSHFGSHYYGYVQRVELKASGTIYVDMAYMTKDERDLMLAGELETEYEMLNAFNPEMYTFEEVA